MPYYWINTMVLIWISKALLLFLLCVSLEVFSLICGPYCYFFQFSGDLDFHNVIDPFSTENKTEQNPTLILKRMQYILAKERPLEITDEGVCPEGEISLLFMDRLWETGRDELKLLDNKSLALEVQFYNEVKKMAVHYERLIFTKVILRYWSLIVSLAQLTLSQSKNNYFAICVLLEILEGFTSDSIFSRSHLVLILHLPISS